MVRIWQRLNLITLDFQKNWLQIELMRIKKLQINYKVFKEKASDFGLLLKQRLDTKYAKF